MLPDDVGRMKPLVGISCCTKLFGMFGMPNHAASDTYVQATHSVVGAVPVLLPSAITRRPNTPRRTRTRPPSRSNKA